MYCPIYVGIFFSSSRNSWNSFKPKVSRKQNEVTQSLYFICSVVRGQKQTTNKTPALGGGSIPLCETPRKDSIQVHSDGLYLKHCSHTGHILRRDQAEY